MSQSGALGSVTITDGAITRIVSLGPLGASILLAGDLDFAQFEALQFVLENRTSDPGAPVAGQMWLRTDL